MTRQPVHPPGSGQISRRGLLRTIGTAAALASMTPRAQAQQAPAPAGKPVDPPSTITNPPREFGPNAPPTTYPDPDVLVLDPAFNRLRTFNSPIVRLWTGALWSEGPAWNSQGQYLVWSDIPNNRQLRWLNDDGRVSVFRHPSNNSNGNTFDFQGRQLSCEHLTRRVVRYENDGSVTVIADSYQGTHLIGPNDIACHPDGSYWFTDLGAGGQLYEGTPDVAGGFSNKEGQLNPRLGQPPEIGTLRRELPSNVYRVDRNGKIELMVSEKQIGGGSNGIAFSPDYKKVYLVRGGDIYSLDVGTDNKLTNQKQFLTMTIDGVRCGSDGLRCDVHGNLWCSSNAGRNVGYSGVTVWNPDGQLIGRIRLPEVCANVAFGGPERNRLFMVASQSLYAVYLNTQGAAPG